MEGISIELLLLLLFGAFMVLNAVMQRAVKRRQALEAPPEPLEDEQAWEEAHEQEDFATPTRVAARVTAPAAAAAAAPAARRFSRPALFGDRRAVQDAFVVATILGRCRADEPHENR